MYLDRFPASLEISKWVGETDYHVSYLYARKIKVLVRFPFSQPPQFNFGNFFIQYGTRCALALNSTMNINLIEKNWGGMGNISDGVRSEGFIRDCITPPPSQYCFRYLFQGLRYFRQEKTPSLPSLKWTLKLWLWHQLLIKTRKSWWPSSAKAGKLEGSFGNIGSWMDCRIGHHTNTW